MNSKRVLTQWFISFALIFFSINTVNASLQTPVTDTSITHTNEEFQGQDSSKLHFLALNATLSSNRLETSKLLLESIPQVITGCMYYNPLGFYLNADYNSFFNAEVPSYAIFTNIGYTHSFKKIDLDLNYSRNFFNGEEILDSYIYKNAIDLTANYNWKTFTSTINGSWISDEFNDYYLNSEHYINLDYENVLFNDDYLSFSPGFNIGFGSEKWLIESEFFRTLIRIKILDKTKFNPKDFSYLGTDITLPVSYSLGKFMINAQWVFYIPTKRYIDLGFGPQSAFIFSFSYIFDL